jgi:hydroxyethylthiazole kinase-like uncharacterized protein yjeF
MQKFTDQDLKKLWKPAEDSRGEDNGQVTIIGGSELFTGAPLLSMQAASRLVDMVFLCTPQADREVAEKAILFSKLKSVIWVPRSDIDSYIEKSDAVLIGPGMMRYKSKEEDEAGRETKKITEDLLGKWQGKKWVIDGGSLQVMDKKFIPRGAVLTPNMKEYEILFNSQFSVDSLQLFAKSNNCTILYKSPVSYVTDGETTYVVEGGNAGLTKGGTGDVLAGIITGLLAKNPPLLSGAAGSWLIKKTADMLFEKVGYNYNADDVAENVFQARKSQE